MRLQTFLEKKGEKAHREAIAMGLQYKGFGYWADPQTGESKYKTVNDQLVPVEPDVESDLYKGNEKEGDPVAQGAPQGQMAGPGGAAAGAMQQMIGQGISQGTPEGMMAAPRKNTGWEAGPDGDTCIGDEKPEVATDVFVGKTNYDQWTAGPDGSNAMELGEMRKLIEGDSTEMADILFNNKSVKKPYHSKDAAHRNVKKVAHAVRGKAVSDMGSDTQDEVDHFKGLPGGLRTQRLHAFMQDYGVDNAEDPRYGDEIKAQRAASQGARDAKLKQQFSGMDRQKAKDQRIVVRMNKELKDEGYFADIDYDLQDEGEEIGEGAFGQVFLGGDGQSVIKDGEIGMQELAVLRRLRDDPRFPTLLNGYFETPFSHESSSENNPYDRSGERRAPGQSKYFNPSTASEFDERFPTARGRYAMSLAKGRTWSQVADEMLDNGDEEGLHEGIRKIMRLRRDMHLQGIAHNDMHGGNFMVDDDGNINVIDLGMAQENPLAALSEGLGALSGHDPQFFMGAAPGSWMDNMRTYTPIDIDETFESNVDNIRQRIMDSLDVDEDEMDDYMEDIEEFVKGGIRNPDSHYEKLQERFPFLQDENNVQELISMLYEGFGEDKLSDRMSRAYDRLRDTQKAMTNIRNTRRLRKGEPLVPMQNLDPDD